jgi:tRNA threonylcarbamoyladenosine biosynthesis protein TsaB
LFRKTNYLQKLQKNKLTPVYILHLETSSTVCSVSISENGKLIYFQEEDNGFTHAEHLHVYIQNAMRDTSVFATELSAVAVDEGPGSYTGLRIGMSSAKGFCYALSIPMITINSLKILSIAAHKHHPGAKYYFPLIDARRMEVYAAVFDKELQPVVSPEAFVVNEEQADKWKAFEGACFFGSGMNKCKELLSSIPNASFLDDIKVSSKYMIDEAYRKFVNKEFADVAYSEPLYAKEFYDTRKDQKE